MLKQHRTLANFYFGAFGGSVNDRIAFRTLKVYYLPPSTTTPYFQSRVSLQNIIVCKQEMLANLLFVVLRFLLTAALHSEP